MGKLLFPKYTPPKSAAETIADRNTKMEAQNNLTKVGGGDITVPTTADDTANKNISESVGMASRIQKLQDAQNTRGGKRRRRRRTFRRRRRR